MAYVPSAAATIQAAEISSPRESASMAQPTAPASATAVQIAIWAGDGLPRPTVPRSDGAAGSVIFRPSAL
ncbi:hypothetical protein GCM10023347_30980 [Streptomyces chumphonensis]